MAGRSVNVKKNTCHPSPSDHHAVTWEISLSLPSRPKIIKIPSRQCADRITGLLLSNQEVTHSAVLLDQLSIYRDDFRRELTKKLNPRARSNDLIEQLLTLEDQCSVNDTVNNYWREYSNNTEALRWSETSEIAYQNLFI